jgi:hypothetical protein
MTTMAGYQFIDQVETYPKPANRGIPAACTMKAIEDVWEFGGWNTDALIFDPDQGITGRTWCIT